MQFRIRFLIIVIAENAFSAVAVATGNIEIISKVNIPTGTNMSSGLH
jgi:hypothetical protein